MVLFVLFKPFKSVNNKSLFHVGVFHIFLLYIYLSFYNNSEAAPEQTKKIYENDRVLLYDYEYGFGLMNT